MPELPEVETIKRGLSGLIIGKAVRSVTHDAPKSFPNAAHDVSEFLIGASITDVRRRAKVLLIDLSSRYTLVIHLKMTGQLVYVGRPSTPTAGLKQRAIRQADMPISSLDSAELAGAQTSSSRQEVIGVSTGTSTGASSSAIGVDATQNEELRFGAGHPNESLVGELPDKSTRVIFTFADGSHLYFNDQRKFGWIRLMPTLEVPNIDFMQKVGPEPLEAEFTAGEFAARFARRAKTSIKAALLDQTVVAGVGNIYADESLWGAKIHPSRLVGSVTNDEFHRLYTELREVMNLAIEKGGSTDKNYVNAEGKRGSYLTFARVFRREGKPCPRCGMTIIKTKVAGRGTHICPHCQVV